MSDILIIQRLIDIGWHFSLDTKNIKELIVKLIVLSLKYINKKKIWEKLFVNKKTNHVDWSLITDEFNALQDLFFWLPVIEKISWVNLPTENENAMSPLTNMKKAIRGAGLESPVAPHLSGHLLILYLLHGIPVLNAFEMMTCRIFKKNTHQSSAIILAHCSDKLHTPEEYEHLFYLLLDLDHIVIETDSFEKQLQYITLQNNSINQFVKKNKEYCSSLSRPRLRDLLKKSNDDKVFMDIRLGTWETYTAFCQLHQFPNILNDVTKQKLYFLASQTQWNWKPYIENLIGGNNELCEKIQLYPVTTPDVEHIYNTIQTLNVNGNPPFDELFAFKKKCFVNFPVSLLQTMNLNLFLRLYVIVYQSLPIWKTLWKMTGTLLSPQIINDCEKFTEENPFNSDGFIHFLI